MCEYYSYVLLLLQTSSSFDGLLDDLLEIARLNWVTMGVL